MLLIFYGSILGTAILFRLLEVAIPSWIFWILAFIGLFWASFTVYLEKVKEISIKNNQIKKGKSIIKEEEVIKPLKKGPYGKPELTINLQEGREYSYELGNSRSTSRKEDYNLQSAPIILHARLSNTGGIGFDIISIEAKYEERKLPWIVYLSKIFEKEKEINFPKHLKINGFLLCDIRNIMDPSAYLNNAQFAARLAGLKRESDRIRFRITVETKDIAGKMNAFTFEDTVSIGPLIDLYVAKWQEEGQTNLLRLARFERKITKKRKSDNE